MEPKRAIPGERMPPLYFAGRQAELAAFRGALGELCETRNPSGGIALTVGPPGSGKTQLAVKFAKDVQGANVSGRTVSALVLPPEDLAEPTALFLAIATAVREAAAGEKAADHNAKVTGGRAGGFGLTFDVRRRSSTLNQMLLASDESGMWRNKALVLMLDELQTIKDLPPPCAASLRVLHQGLHSCPILLMGFGLQHTFSALSKAGISRIAQPLQLGLLNETDTRQAFVENLREAGYPDVPAASVNRLATASQGFPQHINGYLEGAAAALDRHGLLAGPALDQALAHGERRRIAYYDQRLLAGHSRRPMIEVARAMDRARSSELAYHKAKQVLRDAEFDEADLDLAIAHGSLLRDERDNVSFAIPSFHAYMRQLLAQQEAETRPPA